MMKIRPATEEDVTDMVALSDLKRTQYEHDLPLFWRKAEGAAEKQARYFRSQLPQANVIALVAHGDGLMQGFILANVTTAPPVYDPGGRVCVIDDFVVAGPRHWPTVGRALLAEARGKAKELGAVLSVVVCGHLDEPKRSMLQATGAAIASEWYVDPIS